jgi:multidrug efflux system outer membrane protein
MKQKSMCLRFAVTGGLLFSLLLTGCSLAPRYEGLAAPVPATWPAQTPVAGSPAPGIAVPGLDWQDVILDEQLQIFVETALENNRDLRQALLNMDAVRAQYRIKRSARVPGFNVQSASSRERVSSDLSGTGNADIQSSYQVGLGLSAFEIDLFGRVRNLSEAALQEYLATEQATQATQISLIAEVVRAYLTRASAQERHDLTKQTLETRRISLALIDQRRRAGAASDLDYQEALVLAEQAQAELERTARELAQADNGLTLLMGTSMVDRPRPGTVGHPLLQENLASGLPSDLIQRRPDIKAAEHRLMARNADIGAARAAFFPRISLTGRYGISSNALSGLFDSGSSAWLFTPQLHLPIFDGGRNRANLDLAKIRKDLAVAQYEKTIQVAFREVSDALAARDTLQREERSRIALAAASTESLRLAKARYKQGVDSHLRYLDSQRSSFANQMGLIETRQQRQVALVNLFKVLGGGWNLTPGTHHTDTSE